MSAAVGVRFVAQVTPTVALNCGAARDRLQAGMPAEVYVQGRAAHGAAIPRRTGDAGAAPRGARTLATAWPHGMGNVARAVSRDPEVLTSLTN